MRKNSVKNTRINSEVLKELSRIISREIKDPRIAPMTSVVSVEVAPDLKTCKAYISVLGDKEAQESTLEGLRSAHGYIRRELARSINLRNTPDVRFILDQSIEYGVNMSKKIDEINAAIQAAPDAFISVGMATTFFTQQLNAAGIEFSDIDSFTKSNGEAITSGKLVYLAGKYSSSVGPAFALIMNAINGNIVRDADGNAVSISQNYQVATDEATFDEFYKTDNGDNPIYNKETLDKIIGDSVTCDDITKLVESK